MAFAGRENAKPLLRLGVEWEKSLPPTAAGSLDAARLREPFSDDQPRDMPDQYHCQDHDQHPTFSIPRKALNKGAPLKVKVTTGGAANDRKAGQQPRLRVLNDWLLEILSCILIIAALIAIVAILHSHHNQPLSQWPYSLSINTLISVMVTIMKAAMLLITAEGLSQLKWAWFRRRQQRPLLDLAKYDMASRGPLGSLRMLLTLRHQHVIASIGAFITITALAIDPFAQQIIRYYSCPTIDSKVNATIPRTNAFQGGIDSGALEGAGTYPLATSMQSAINGGVFNPGTINIPYTCSSGNCTFGQYRSLGYCSTCEDVSNNLTTFSSNVTNTQTFTNINGSVTSIEEWSILTNTSLPSGLSALYYNGSLSQNSTYLVMDSRGPVDRPYEIILGASRLTRWNSVYANSFPCNETAAKNTWYCHGLGAAACRIDPCIRTYSATIHAGNFLETLEEYAFPPWGHTAVGYESVAVDVDCLSSSERQSLIRSGYQIGLDTHWLAYNKSIFNETGQTYLSYYFTPTDGNTTKGDIPWECIYDFADFTTISVSSWLRSYFQGVVTQGNDLGWGGPPVLQSFFNDSNVDFPGINSTFSSVADSMTNYIRRNGNPGFSAPVLGVVHQTEACVQIRWAWLAFPAALVLLTLFFFVAMVMEVGFTADSGHNWKSSPLPFMFYGLEYDTVDHSQGRSSGLLRVQELEKTAKDMQVRLGPSENGWKFLKMD